MSHGYKNNAHKCLTQEKCCLKACQLKTMAMQE